MQAGDKSVFAFGISFHKNPDGDADPATPEERASWGAFSLWANGENLCSHMEQNEVVTSAHWYMIHVIEWLVKNWDPIFHEERFSLANVGLSAAELMSRTKRPPLRLKEVDEFDWLDKWSAWWSRHNVRGGREGGFFPDLYLRRYRDLLEVSTGDEEACSVPADCYFLAQRRSYRVDPAAAAESIYTVLEAAVRHLRAMAPNSARLEQLTRALQAVKAGGNDDARMAWMVGLEGDLSAYRAIDGEVDRAFSGVSESVREQLFCPRRHTSLVIAGTAYAKLLYGAERPNTTLRDVATLSKGLVANCTDDASAWLETLDDIRNSLSRHVGAPGEAGSALGEEFCARYAEAASFVDVGAVVSDLDIAVSNVMLDDTSLRAISVFGPTQCPHIYVNQASRWAQSEGARRFTLAHELCHLILDREYGNELAVASGPWAPVAIEQRANAFAAAFLMPTWLLRDAIFSLDAPLKSEKAIRSIAARLKVSPASLVDRLYNLSELSYEDRVLLRGMFQGGMTHLPQL